MLPVLCLSYTHTGIHIYCVSRKGLLLPLLGANVTKTGARETPWRCIMHEPDRGKRATGENRVLLDGTRDDDDDDDVYAAALQKEKQPCV